MTKKILDACCGGRMFWFDKSNPLCLFVDIRRESMVACDGRNIVVDPDVLADFTALPFPDESFYHVVFDPPHLNRAGKNSWLAQKYGRLDAEWPQTIKDGFDECWRVLKTNGTLVFKWNEDQISHKDVLALAPVAPLYGNRRNKTHWFVFFKEEAI